MLPDEKEWYEKMVGDYFNQPLHLTLRQFRFLPMILLYVSVDILYRLVTLVEKATELSTEQTLAALGVLIVGLFTLIWKAIENISTRHLNDE